MGIVRTEILKKVGCNVHILDLWWAETARTWSHLYFNVIELESQSVCLCIGFTFMY